MFLNKVYHNKLYKKHSAYKSECYEGLIDGRGGWSRGKCKLDENKFMWTLFLQSYLEDSRPKVRRSYNTVVNYIIEHCPEYLEEIPSERTFRRKIESIPTAVLDCARKGEGTIKDNYIPRVRRNYSNIEANDIWITVIALYNAILKHGKPKVLYVDNGSEFCTYDLFGRGIRKLAIEKIFGSAYSPAKDRPTNAEYLGALAEQIRYERSGLKL